MLEQYEQFLARRLSKFQDEAVSAVLASFDDPSVVLDGDRPFPRQLVEEILESERSYEDRVVAVLVAIGSWCIASSGAQWSAGPIEDGIYSERVGIGLKVEDGQAFSPLVGHAEEIVVQWPSSTQTLDATEALAEFDKKMHRERR
ncbi:hypothetical protein [Corynebacterium kozikiae]|uniref:hypothetical protein n=1 Tax=Corynebacterium kozikiae TaxID=2968469 RepID=UPI00211C1A61|nr:hypothetical protein [Corynebacterium sp. 76QC2CO]MCQ9343601.1 hypothetical protein [Corynebacterium sp. 76QC2CO]